MLAPSECRSLAAGQQGCHPLRRLVSGVDISIFEPRAKHRLQRPIRVSAARVPERSHGGAWKANADSREIGTLLAQMQSNSLHCSLGCAVAAKSWDERIRTTATCQKNAAATCLLQ